MTTPTNTPDSNRRKTRILVVCAWPLGGIRTFLRYNYRLFDKERFEITILANPTLERESLENDFRGEGIRVLWSEPWLGQNVLCARVFALLRRSRFDCLHSQGFTAAVHVALANLLHRRPHVLTMHGILEPKYFQGWAGPLKRAVFRNVLKRVTVFHAVGQDMLDHFQQEMPQLKADSSRAVVIRNGIDTARFAAPAPSARAELRRLLACPDQTFVFGYFGRFMPEKGFDLLIKAADAMRKSASHPPFRVLAMGSGDYESWARATVERLGLGGIIHFHPFDPNADRFIKGCDTVVVPSRHEAYPLLPCEALSAGIPVIASEAMGLREAVAGTPALSFPLDDYEALARTMGIALADPSLRNRFLAFQATAVERFDVARSAAALMALFEELVSRK